MQETLPFLTNPNPCPPHAKHHDFPSLSRPPNLLLLPAISSNKIAPLPKPPKLQENGVLPPPLPPRPAPDRLRSNFQEKMLFLDSLGLDFFSLVHHHPPIVMSSLSDLKSTVELLYSVNLSSPELCRIVSMCPEILTLRPAAINPVLTFLLREARVNFSDLKKAISRRPRLLVCSVDSRLRPTLYFLQSIGISEVNKHTCLLSCCVENKLVPRIDYFQKIGFSRRETVSMFRRFPQLFNYSVKDSYEPKLNYFVVEMGRDLKEVKEFPQYFSFSLENRIKPRHQCCVEKGVCFPLPVLLKTREAEFLARLEVCCNSSLPFKTSPLSCDSHSV